MRQPQGLHCRKKAESGAKSVAQSVCRCKALYSGTNGMRVCVALKTKTSAGNDQVCFKKCLSFLSMFVHLKTITKNAKKKYINEKKKSNTSSVLVPCWCSFSGWVTSDVAVYQVFT